SRHTFMFLPSSLFCFSTSSDTRSLPSFPTRRSSDLINRHLHLQVENLRLASGGGWNEVAVQHFENVAANLAQLLLHLNAVVLDQDRKSTRLNSSHVSISYAVFCLKKKRQTQRW